MQTSTIYRWERTEFLEKNSHLVHPRTRNFSLGRNKSRTRKNLGRLIPKSRKVTVFNILLHTLPNVWALDETQEQAWRFATPNNNYRLVSVTTKTKLYLIYTNEGVFFNSFFSVYTPVNFWNGELNSKVAMETLYKRKVVGKSLGPAGIWTREPWIQVRDANRCATENVFIC